MNLKEILEKNLQIDKYVNLLFFDEKINQYKKLQHNFNKSEIIKLIIEEFNYILSFFE